MQLSDLKKLRKVIKSKEPPVDWVYGLYVSAENEPVWEQLTLLGAMEEAEYYRHINLFSRILAGGLGKNVFAVPLTEQPEGLLNLRSAPGKELSELEGFRNFLLEEHPHTDPYYAMLAHIAWDVPAKGTDRRRLEDGDAVYSALLFALCPASLSRPALGYEDDRVKELARRWNIGNPVCGFVYPSFSDRAEDRNEVFESSAAPAAENLFSALFQEKTAPAGAKDQKELFQELISRLDVSVEDAAALGESLKEKASQEAPSIDAVSLCRLANDCGIDTEGLADLYEETVGDTPLSAAAVSESFVTVKTDSGMIRVPAEKSSLIQTRVIDGVEYLLIPADGTVLVNEIPCSFKAR